MAWIRYWRGKKWQRSTRHKTTVFARDRFLSRTTNRTRLRNNEGISSL